MERNSVRRGFFRSAVSALMAARERQAQRYVARALMRMDDKTLKQHGYDRAELQRLGGTESGL